MQQAEQLIDQVSEGGRMVYVHSHNDANWWASFIQLWDDWLAMVQS
jgi:hypothetical protein